MPAMSAHPLFESDVRYTTLSMGLLLRDYGTFQCTFHSFFYNASEFIVDPVDETLEVNDTDVILTCMPALDMEQLINWEIYLRNGTFLTVTGADKEVQRSR